LKKAAFAPKQSFLVEQLLATFGHQEPFAIVSWMFMVKPVIYKIYSHLKKSTGYHHLPMLRPKQERPHQSTCFTDNFWNVS
jgi:hypothetical protein